jgi:GNAT superfamily N-acetyltransferase
MERTKNTDKDRFSRIERIMELVVGYDLEEFKRYYRKLAEDGEWRGTFGWSEELGESWERVLAENPSLLIVMKEDDEIIGHIIWHESNTEEHRKGEPRSKEDKEILRRLLGGKKDLVELHEIWLRQAYRGKGYGKEFFEFFEDFIKSRGCDAIVYYADHPAAIAICRKRGYKEGFLREEGRRWHVFCLLLI